MISLERLKNMGAIASSLSEVSLRGVKCVDCSRAASMTEEEQKKLHGIVTVDTPVWLATSKGRPAQEAATVYSCNSDDQIGCWKSASRTFLLMKLSNSQLQTISKFNIMEEKKMANLGDLNLGDMNAFSESITPEELRGSAPAVATEDKQPTEKDIKAAQMQQELSAIRSSSNYASMANNDEAIIHNHQFGRLLFFFTKTDAAVKLSKQSKVVKDGNGNPVLLPDVSIETATNSKGRVSPKYCQKESFFTFTQVKPGAPIGVAIETPVCSDIELTKLHSGETINIDKSQKDTKVHIIPIEAAYRYIAWNYGNWIKEDETILGALASRLDLVSVPKVKKNEKTGATATYINMKFAVSKENGKRKQLLVTGNFFPIKTFDTVSVDNIDADTAKMLNYHLKASLAKQGSYDSLTDEAKAKITVDEDGNVTSSWFDHGEKIEVLKFDAASDSDFVTDVRIPIRIETATKKDPNKKRYAFSYTKVGEEHGPQEQPLYKRLIEATGLSVEEFIGKIDKLATRAKTSKKATPSYTARDLLAVLENSNYVVGNSTKSLADIQEELFEM